MMYTLEAVHQLIGGQLEGSAEEVIRGLNTLERAEVGDLAFAEHERYTQQVSQTHASGIIVTTGFPPIAGKNLLRVSNPRVAFMTLMKLFSHPSSTPHGIHPSAVIAPTALLDPEVSIGECVVVRAQARIGRGTIIDSGVHVGSKVAIGEQCVIEPNVVLMDGVRIGHRVIIHGGSVIGGDGFGYVWMQDRHVKIPQLGTVTIEDDVEIGCNVCVDRSTLGSTIVKRGTKVDNLVQIAHNNVIGEDVIMAGQVGLAGSVTLGNRVMLGGQVGIADHITIGDDVKIGAASAVFKNIHPGEFFWGTPSRPSRQVKRELAHLARLPKLAKRFKELLAYVETLEARLASLERQRHDKTSPPNSPDRS